MLELKVLIKALSQLKALVGEYNSKLLLEGKNVFILGLTQEASSKLVTDLREAGLFAHDSESPTPGQYSIVAHLN